MHPTFVFEQAPDVLTLLGHVELVRQKAMKNAHDVLELNNLYRKRGNEAEAVPLSRLEQGKVEDVLKRDARDRETFVFCIQWISLYVCLVLSCSYNVF